MNCKHSIHFLFLAGLALPAAAGSVDADAVLGGALGGAAGAAVGSAAGGRDGAIVGSGIGGALGAAIATQEQKKETVRVEKEVVYVEEEGRHDNGLHRGHYRHKHKHKHRHDD